MEQFLQVFILLPLAAFFISLLVQPKREASISAIAISATGVHAAGILALLVYWLCNDRPVLNIKHIVLFKSGNIEIFIDFYFDQVTAVFAVAGSILSFVVSVFSKYYLHREEGYKRFFCTLLLFVAGYNLIVFSGNFETLFMGWEMLGISSLLLIAFYRDRYLPVKNGLKVISVYRLGDICLILAMWMSHHIWHENITFLKLNELKLVAEHLAEYQGYGAFVASMIVIAAAAKSAQLPFSSWLPRAMEGPTTSSAIFYGSLSVHLGVFLLLRTYPYWESLLLVKSLVIGTGAVTCLLATSMARVQSTVKTQIAYSSVVQIGLMFIEVALGFHTLALIHFTANAFLRTYQLLVSPSVLSYLIHDMVFNYKPAMQRDRSSFLTVLKNSVYILSVREWNLDTLQYRFLWNPFKWMGRSLQFLGTRISVAVLSVVLLGGWLAYVNEDIIPGHLLEILPYLFSFVGLALILKAFAERGDARHAWIAAIAGQLFVTLSVAVLNEAFNASQILIYLGGAIISAFAGYLCLRKIKSIDDDIRLNRYHGYTYEQPVLGVVFLLACLGTIGLPFTPTFIGIDLLFSHIHKDQILLIIFTSLSFIFIELSVLRIYIRIFLGPHKKAYHPIAFKYS